jgi:hypothetical protein
VLVGAVAVFIAYRALRGTGMQTAAEMKQALSAEIPVGTSVTDAEARLRTRGFRISRMTNASFSDQGRVREHLDYVYGDMSEGVGLVSRRWQVAVVHQHGAVTEVSVSTGLVGP